MPGPGLHDVLCQPALFTQTDASLDDMVAAGIETACCASVVPSGSKHIDHRDLTTVRGAGLLPEYLEQDHRARTQQVEQLIAMVDHELVRFVGEVGLDRREKMPPITQQQEVLEAILLAAQQRQLPVLLHVVRAHGPLVEVLDRCPMPLPPLAMHGFTGAAAAAQALCQRGLFISFGPGLLNPKARRAQQAACTVPDDRLLIESDAPTYPPSAIAQVVDRLAQLRETSAVAIARLTAENAQRWLNSPGPTAS